MDGGEDILEVAPGLVRVTLPVALELGGVHAYLLAKADGMIAVSLGPRSDAERRALLPVPGRLRGGRESGG